MDLLGITAISFAIFILMLAPLFISRVYQQVQAKRLLREYLDSNSTYGEFEEEDEKEEDEPLPSNVISLEEYKRKA